MIRNVLFVVLAVAALVSVVRARTEDSAPPSPAAAAVR
jgi:hypothetical protein